MPLCTARRTTDTVIGIMKRIPWLAPGILFFSFAIVAPAAPLAWELYREGNWSACSVEARRLLLANPSDETGQFLLSATAARLHPDTTTASNLLTIATTTASPEIRAHASLEAARLILRSTPADAWAPAYAAFLASTETDTFLASLAILEHVLQQAHEDTRPPAEQVQQYRSCESLFRRVPDALRPSPPKTTNHRISYTPARLIVAFYRRCIRPAIGSRCSLSPSCSEYFLLSSRKHGLLGFPMTADRLVREPSVVSASRHPSAHSRHSDYRDPVEDHDFWMAYP